MKLIEKMDGARCLTPEDDVPQAMAFTVTFGTAKTANVNNKFIKRHIRNLSLPIASVYENKVLNHSPVNGKALKGPGNHSEGYFSSEEEHGGPKLFVSKSKAPVYLGSKPCSVSEVELTNNLDKENGDDEDECCSDNGSETGTYTIEKEPPEVISARLSIEANFGIDPCSENLHTSRDSNNWISEWAAQTVNHKNTFQSSTLHQNTSKPPLVKSNSISKIPSPIVPRARIGMPGPKVPPKSATDPPSKSPNTQLHPSKLEEPSPTPSDSKYETESYLKTTERVMSAMQARMSLSMDSEPESDSEPKVTKKGLQHSDSSASESGPRNQHNSSIANTTRYRNISVTRRGKPEEEEKKVTNDSNVRGRRVDVGPPPVKTPVAPPAATPSSKPKTPSLPPPGLSRTDTGRLSMRSTRPVVPQSPQLARPKTEFAAVKKKPAGGGRSNSTLSLKEVEFQNWKRRKSYDPMKAAAEGKKKEAAKKQPPTMTQSTTNATTTPRSPINSVLRSASFHGTRQLTGPSSSEEEEEITLSAEDEEWPVTPAPKTSLENTPRGSRVSLYSNNSNNSPRSRHKLEGVDNLVVSAIANLSHKLKGCGSNLLKKLRYLYDEESGKFKQLTAEIEQLDLSESSTGSPQKSSSKELALTLKNLKRIDSMLKVLDEVLFDNADYE